jgi:hypothetical protein
MRRAAIVLLAWGALLAVMTAAQAPFLTIRGPFGVHGIEPIMLGSSSCACLVAGALLWWLEVRQRGAGERPRALADESFATAALIAGLALALLGAGFGLWLILIGAGLVALGGGGLIREGRARKRAGAPR